MTRTTRNFLVTILLCLPGAAGGALAAWARIPLPWMTGSLLAAMLVVMLRPATLPLGFAFSQRLRTPFISVIGMAIGFQVTPDLAAQLPLLALSLIFMTAFVPLAHLANFTIFRRVGGYSSATAFFAGSPGGLMESIALGEENGADIRLLSLQQFLRIIMVIAILPAAISYWHGGPVGSAAGLAGNLPVSSLPMAANLAALAALAATGVWLGHVLHLPAGHLLGALLLAAALNLSPLAGAAVPFWLLIVAQIVIGTSLGARFYGIGPRVIVRGLGLSVLSAGAMLLLGVAIALVLSRLTDLQFDALLVSFAPGGVTEMSLIAVSLGTSPAVVAVHHLYRIGLTVALLSLGFRALKHRLG